MSLEHPTLSDDQVAELISYIRDLATPSNAPLRAKRDRVLILLMLDAGLRCSEAVQLPFRCAFWQGEVRPILEVPVEIAKYGIGGSIPISLELKDALVNFASKTREMPPEENDWPAISLFTYPRTIGRRQAARIVEDVCQAAIGIHVHPHMLRHTFGNRMRKLCDGPTLQNLMRHKNLSSTQVYMHPTIDDACKAMAKLDAERTGPTK